MIDKYLFLDDDDDETPSTQQDSSDSKLCVMELTTN